MLCCIYFIYYIELLNDKISTIMNDDLIVKVHLFHTIYIKLTWKEKYGYNTWLQMITQLLLCPNNILTNDRVSHVAQKDFINVSNNKV